MALVVVKNPTIAEDCRKLLFGPNDDHVTFIDAARPQHCTDHAAVAAAERRDQCFI